jgi:hypothetical protein
LVVLLKLNASESYSGIFCGLIEAGPSITISALDKEAIPGTNSIINNFFVNILLSKT